MSTTNQTNQVTFLKISTGIFSVLINGAKTPYEVVNGCRGLSGRDTVNIYLIANHSKGTYKPIGSLVSAKKIAARWASDWFLKTQTQNPA